MFKVVEESIGEFYQHYPRISVVVTVSHLGRKNAMAVAWHSSVSFQPPLYGIAVAPKRYTYEIISESKQFGVNFMSYEKAAKIASVGGSSGKIVDKFTEFDLQEDEPLKTGVPILSDAYAVYECEVVENRVFGDHAWIIGEVVALHTAREVFKGNGILDLGLVRPALYLGGENYCSTDMKTVQYLDRQTYGKR